MPLHILIAITGLLGCMFMLLGLLVLRITLTRRLKKKLKPTGDYWETGTLDFGFLNTYLFAWACVLPYMRRSEFYRSLYPDLDILKVANRFEKAVAYGAICGLAMFLLCGVIFVLIEP